MIDPEEIEEQVAKWRAVSKGPEYPLPETQRECLSLAVAVAKAFNSAVRDLTGGAVDRVVFVCEEGEPRIVEGERRVLFVPILSSDDRVFGGLARLLGEEAASELERLFRGKLGPLRAACVIMSGVDSPLGLCRAVNMGCGIYDPCCMHPHNSYIVKCGELRIPELEEAYRRAEEEIQRLISEETKRLAELAPLPPAAATRGARRAAPNCRALYEECTRQCGTLTGEFRRLCEIMCLMVYQLCQMR